MPKSIFDKKNKYDKLLTLLRGTAITKEKNYIDLGNMVGCHQNTIVARFKHPENFTLDELFKIGRGLNISIEDIRASINY